MTYYHDIVNELEESSKPLTVKELHDRIGGHRTEVYRAIKKVRKRDDVVVDRDYERNGVRMYQLQKKKVSHLT